MPVTSVQLRAHGVQRDTEIHFTGSISRCGHCFQTCEIRRDQRDFLLHFTGRCSAKSPQHRAGSVPQKSASVTSGIFISNNRQAFRLRFRDGRLAAAPFSPSLRLRFTFPFAEPQAEAG